MKPRILYLTVFLCLLLTGCSGFDGSYVHVTPHREQGSSSQGEAVSASNYSQLLSVLEGMVSSGTESGVINVANYDRDMVEDRRGAVCPKPVSCRRLCGGADGI